MTWQEFTDEYSRGGTIRLGSFSAVPCSGDLVECRATLAIGLAMRPRVLLLDEPTASLDTQEVEMLFTLMRQLRDQGVSLIFVTHFLDQVYEISDRLTVLLRDKGQRHDLVAAVFALGDDEIARYVASGEPRGKAGSYAIQSQAAAWIEHIAGSYSGIMGLPLFETAELLRVGALQAGVFDQRQGDVLADGQRGEQSAALVEHAEAPLQRAPLLADVDGMPVDLALHEQALDGADAGRFLQAVKKRLESGAFEV